ncbi:MAG: PrsW family intramembrane metalloprotease [Lachnospiraceae bacterium]|nr:PrsW family intramembrane metalloprotease [Lachnospiraceae bacterium]
MVYSENILVCIAIPLLIALIFTQRSTRRFIGSFVMGMLICLLSAYISGFLRQITETPAEDMAIYFSPIIEEIMKILPLVFYIFVFEADNSKLITVCLGLGLGFASFENSCYLMSFGAPELTFVIIRGLAVGVMHVVCSLMLIMGIILQKRLFTLSFPGIVGALSLSTAFHGFYNLLVSEPGISTYIGYTMPVLSAVALYFPYRTLKRQEAQKAALLQEAKQGKTTGQRETG